MRKREKERESVCEYGGMADHTEGHVIADGNVRLTAGEEVCPVCTEAIQNIL